MGTDDANDQNQDNSKQSSQDGNATSSGNGSSGNDGSSQSDSSQDGGTGKNWLEWTITIAGAAIVLFIVGYLVYDLVAGPSGPPELIVSLGPPETVASTVEVPIEVLNKGAMVAELAVVEVCAGPEACAQITFDYVPYGSTISGTVGLKAPLQAPLTTRVVSFRKP